MSLAEDNKIMAQRVAELEAALAAKNKLSFKVSDKGALSVYGLQRFPVTLYREQWERLFVVIPEMQVFISANGGRLSIKK